MGSPELITDAAGNEVVRPSFGAYGERRDGTDWSGAPSAADLIDIANTSRRGFTGHEHLDAVGLIHMNGRVYDPVAGRFLAVDPIIPLGSSQSPNGYSYVWNNPFAYTDPSGFVLLEEVVVKAKKTGLEWGVMSGNDLVLWGVRDRRTFTADDGTQEVQDIAEDGTVTVTAQRIEEDQPPPSPVFVMAALPSSGAQGARESEAEDSEGATDCNVQLVEIGNWFAEKSDQIGDVSNKLVMGGLVTTGVGAATFQPEVYAIGIAVTGTGGVAGIMAGGFQIVAGGFQGLGLNQGFRGYSNATNAIVTLGAGRIISRAISGPTPPSGRTVSQRRTDLFLRNSATVTGGIYDALTYLMEQLGPQQKTCGGQ